MSWRNMNLDNILYEFECCPKSLAETVLESDMKSRAEWYGWGKFTLRYWLSVSHAVEFYLWQMLTELPWCSQRETPFTILAVREGICTPCDELKFILQLNVTNGHVEVANWIHRYTLLGRLTAWVRQDCHLHFGPDSEKPQDSMAELARNFGNTTTEFVDIWAVTANYLHTCSSRQMSRFISCRN